MATRPASSSSTRDTQQGSPLSTPLTDRVAFLLSQLGYYFAQNLTERLRPLGLLPKHLGLLAHVGEADGPSQQQLADAIGIHRNAMVKLVDELEQRGLVERRRHPRDRRAYAVHLTPTARELLPQAEQIADEYEAELATSLHESERQHLRQLLHRLRQHTGLHAGVHPGLQEEHDQNLRGRRT